MITRDGRYLYAIDADARKVFGWTLRRDGELVAVGSFDGVPDTVAGLAAKLSGEEGRGRAPTLDGSGVQRERVR